MENTESALVEIDLEIRNAQAEAHERLADADKEGVPVDVDLTLDNEPVEILDTSADTRSLSPTESTATLVDMINSLKDGHPHDATTDRLARALRGRVPELAKLYELRQIGWRHRELDICFVKERQETKAWFRRYKDVFAALERNVQIVPSPGGRQFEFLDLGCSPGGYASYVLAKNYQSRGVGIALPPSQDGTAFELNKKQRKRFKLHTGDLTMFKLHPPTKETAQATRKLRNMPDEFRDKDLVIMDARQVVTYADIDIANVPWQDLRAKRDRYAAHRLLISQVIIALRVLKRGGTIVATFDHPEWFVTAQLLLMLKDTCREVRTFKSDKVLQVHSEFTVVAKGFGYGPRGDERGRFLKGFEAAWFEITFGGPQKQGRPLMEDDLDFLISYETMLNKRLDELVELAMEPWEVQASGLRDWFYKRGILARNVAPDTKWRAELPACEEIGSAVVSVVDISPLFIPVEKVIDVPLARVDVPLATVDIPLATVDIPLVKDLTSEDDEESESFSDPAWVLI